MEETPKRKGFVEELWDWSTEGIWGWIGTASLIVGLALALFQYLYPSLSQSIAPRMSAFLNFAIPLGAGASVFLGRFLMAPYFVWKKANKLNEEWRELFEPKLIARCGSQIPGSKVVEDNGVDFNQVFRVEVNALGFNPIQNCEGTLLQVEKDGEKLWANRPMSLTFFRADKPDSTRKKIDLTSPQYLEVVGIIQKENGFRKYENCIRLAVNTHLRELSASFQSKFSCPGEYLISIAISGHSTVPIGVELRFIWTGDYETSSLTLVKQYSMAPKPPLSVPSKSVSRP